MNTKGKMMCPVCDVSLSMTDRQGIEIDFCPSCRGVWLDRGELDKIIERSLPMVEPQRAAAQPAYDDDRDDGRGKHHRSRSKHGYRRKSWLHELFD